VETSQRLMTIGPNTMDRRHRSEIRHDIQHQLGLIIQLAGVVGLADDVGLTSRARIEQMLSEMRWLDLLLRAYDGIDPRVDGGRSAAPSERVRVDTVTNAVVGGVRLATKTRLTLTAAPAWAYADPLALWRALRNVVDNAVRATGPLGHVDVQVTSSAGWTVAQIDDDGPGFGGGARGLATLGLRIVQNFATEHGGRLELGSGTLGGGCVRLVLPATPPVGSEFGWMRTDGNQAPAV
jgi:signal transduction histidine kinase